MSDPRHEEVPVTQLYGALRGGDPDALRRLWPMYFRRLAAMAEKKLRGLKSGASDGEDVALNALQSFHRRATRGDFQIEDRDDLWRQLVALTHQKTIDLIRRENRAKRGGGKVLRAGELAEMDSAAGPGPLEAAAAPEPDPATLAEVAERCRVLMEKLGDDTLRRVAQLRMELHSGKEIAQILGVSESSIDRKLRLVREIWAAEAESSGDRDGE